MRSVHCQGFQHPASAVAPRGHTGGAGWKAGVANGGDIMRATCAVTLALSLSLHGCGSIASLADDGSRGAIAACEEATRAKLVSPSSYARVWANFTERGPLDEAEREEWMDRAGCSVTREKAGECSRTFAEKMTTALTKQIAEKKRRGVKLEASEQAIVNAGAWLDTSKTGFVLLEYEAMNPMGVNLRSFAICRLGPPGDNSKFSSRDVFQHGEVSRGEGESAKAQYEQLEGKR